MRFTLHSGDCRRVLGTVADATYDACVTDPPYELGFMGKTWDSSGVAFDPDTWRAVLRVLKPGAHLLAFGGTRTFHRMTCAIEDAGFEIRDCLSWMYGTGFPKSLNIGDGRGTALKPAWEPIVLARKPLVGTVAGNVLAHGTGALNIDACRIALDGESAPTGSGNGNAKSKFSQVANSAGNGGNVTPESGRWPANVVLDDEAAAALNGQSGVSSSTGGSGAASRGGLGKRVYGAFANDSTHANSGGLGDSGGASRFFYCAKVSPDERGESDHPTMKPVELMRWLVRLVTPPGGTVLDPFTGSGSTGVAAVRDGFRFVGIEQDDHYREEIARPRINAESAQGLLFTEVPK